MLVVWTRVVNVRRKERRHSGSVLEVSTDEGLATPWSWRWREKEVSKVALKFPERVLKKYVMVQFEPADTEGRGGLGFVDPEPPILVKKDSLKKKGYKKLPVRRDC